MGRLNEALKVFIRGGKYINTDSSIDDQSPLSDLPIQEILNLIRDVKNSNLDRKQKKDYYDYMMKDAVVSGCVELISDEASVIDEIRSMPYWVDCPDNPEFESIINEWLRINVLKDNMAYLMAYQLLRDGEIFVRTFDTVREFIDNNNIDEFTDRDTVEIAKDVGRGLFTIGDHFELIPYHLDVSDLRLYGSTVGFQLEDTRESNSYKIYNSREYIHTMIDKGESNRIKVELDLEDEPGRVLKQVEVKYGTSYLESSRQAYQILDLIDTMLLSTRVNKSKLIRMVMVEVGNANKTETKKILNRVKTAFSQEALDLNVSYKEGDRTSTIQNVFVPKRNNKGDINVEEFGGNTDIRDIADIEYYTDKFFASMRVPKAFVGMDANITSGLGINTMTKVDIRYARVVMTIKNLIRETLRQIVEYKLSIDNKLSQALDSKEWTIETVPVSSSEEDERLAALSTSVGVAEQIKTLISESEAFNTDEVLEYIFNFIIDLPEFVDMMKGGGKDE